jgi:hypothetical protein
VSAFTLTSYSTLNFMQFCSTVALPAQWISSLPFDSALEASSG